MWDLIVSVPDHCLSFYFFLIPQKTITYLMELLNFGFTGQNKSTTNSKSFVVIGATYIFYNCITCI